MTGTLYGGIVSNQVSVAIPYTGGNGGSYSQISINSTGVNGLTANLNSGVFNVGSGVLTFTITGTPNSVGNANFSIANLGGQSCAFSLSTIQAYPAGTVHCASGPTQIVEVMNPITGKIWMDRNLGATRAAISPTDSLAFGDLYQWGRRADGHQCRNSLVTSTISSIDQPPHGDFILSNNMFDWRSPQNTFLWSPSTPNVPCPSGFRVPFQAELNAERLSWGGNNNMTGAFNSPLKWSPGGLRTYNAGNVTLVNSNGFYWSASPEGGQANFLQFESTNANVGFNGGYRATGMSVRCIKD